MLRKKKKNFPHYHHCTLLYILDVLTANFAYAVYIRLCVRLSPSSPLPLTLYPLLCPSPPLSLFPSLSLSLSLSLSVSYSPSLNLCIPFHCSVFTVSVFLPLCV